MINMHAEDFWHICPYTIFVKRKCIYCDFLSFVIILLAISVEKYFDTLYLEIE